MASIIAAVLLVIMAFLELLLIIGLPLGEFTMGGQHKVLPPMLRLAAASSIVTQLFAATIVFQGGGFMKMWFSQKVTMIICFCFAGFFVINTFMNLISKSKKEKYVMTPLAAVEAVCFALTALALR